MNASLLVVEIANTPETRDRGLMDRSALALDVSGMLFLFDRPTTGPFWNKRTYLPLDILFIGKEGSIVDRIALPSMTETGGRLMQASPRAPYVAVLEVLHGRAPRDTSRVALLPPLPKITIPFVQNTPHDGRRVVALYSEGRGP